MTVARRMIGLVLAALSIWLLVSSLRALFFVGFQTGDVMALLANPVFALPLAGASLGCLGGLLAAGGYPAGAVIAFLGGAIYTIFGVSVFLFGGGKEMWFPKLVFGAMTVMMAVALYRLPRRMSV